MTRGCSRASLGLQQPQQQQQQMSRVNRGNPSLAAGSASGLLQGNASAASGGSRTGRGGYAGAAGSSAATGRNAGGAGSGSEWASPSAGRPPSTSALKPSGGAANNNPTSPNPYAPAFNPAGPASPWSASSEQACTAIGEGSICAQRSLMLLCVCAHNLLDFVCACRLALGPPLLAAAPTRATSPLVPVLLLAPLAVALQRAHCFPLVPPDRKAIGKKAAVLERERMSPVAPVGLQQAAEGAACFAEAVEHTQSTGRATMPAKAHTRRPPAPQATLPMAVNLLHSVSLPSIRRVSVPIARRRPTWLQRHCSLMRRELTSVCPC